MEQAKPGSWGKELDDIGRAFSGAFLFGLPLLFTMEMWWIGTFTDVGKLLFILALSLVINIMLAYFEGFRSESSFTDAVAQAVEAVAVGVVSSVVVLAVLNRIAFGDPLDSILGKIVIQAMPLSIGASVANAIFARSGSNNGGGNGSDTETDGADFKKANTAWSATLIDVGTTVGGALFIGFAIAPTEEIPMLAAEMSYWHLLALIAVTLIVTYIVVFQSGFSGQQGSDDERGPFQHPFTETALSYVVALLVALGVLFMFDQIDFGDPLPDILAKTLVLGMPAAVGGAAGRVLI